MLVSNLFVGFYLIVLRVAFKVALEVFYWVLQHVNDEDYTTTYENSKIQERQHKRMSNNFISGLYFDNMLTSIHKICRSGMI